MEENLFDDSMLDEECTFSSSDKELIDSIKKIIKIYSGKDRNILIDHLMDCFYNTLKVKYDDEELLKIGNQLAIFSLELLLTNEFLDLKNEPIFDKDKNIEYPKEINTLDDVEKSLEYVVHNTRLILSDRYDMKSANLASNCLSTSFDLETICKEKNIRYEHIGIDPKFNNGLFHHFTIVEYELNDEIKRYIVDCTYRQFFTKANSNLNRIGALISSMNHGASIGKYMVINDERKKMAEELLTKGYVEATEENLTYYFNAITFTDRDKYYYEKNKLDYRNINDLEVDIDLNSYIELLVKNRVIDSDGILNSMKQKNKSR